MTVPPSSIDTKPWIAIASASFFLCVALDLFYFPATTTFPDEQRFLASAARLVETGGFWVGGDRAWEMPGTALFYAPFVALAPSPGAAILPIRLAQAALLIVQAILIGVTARRIFRDRRTALIAFAMTAFYPFLLYYQGLLLSETLFNTLLVAGFASLYWWRDRGFRMDAALVLCCACFGAAALTKATLTVVPPILIALLTLPARRASLTIRACAVATLIYAAVLAPWWVRNYLVLDTFVPFTTSAALNLYLGNNPQNPTGGVDWSANVETGVFARLQAMPDEIARQREFTAAALAHIRDDPGGFVQRMGFKFVRFWNIVPNAPQFSGAFYRIISVASFGPVLLLALLTVVLRRNLANELSPILLLIAYFTIVHMVTIASLRYRLPLEPFLILLAAASVRVATGRVISARR